MGPSGPTTTASSPWAWPATATPRRRCGCSRGCLTPPGLPELFCGFAGQPEEAPTLYPVACSPQAWARSTPFGLLEAVMGMGIGRDSRSARTTVLFRNPVLPAQIQRLEIQGLRLGNEAIDLELHRTEEDTGVLVKRRSRGVDVVIHK